MDTLSSNMFSPCRFAQGTVRIAAFNRGGLPLAMGIYTTAQWCANRNALVDDASERAQLDVATIVAEQFDACGFLLGRITLKYAEDGSLESVFESATARMHGDEERAAWVARP
jgi:hypothetical protein